MTMDGSIVQRALARCGRASRIVTVTLNPAVDMGCTAQAVVPVHKVRTSEGVLAAGGGGINVAKVIAALGGEVLALIASGGVTGRLIEELMDQAGLGWQAIPIRGRTRISLNVHDLRSGLDYRFVPEGPTLEQDEWQGALDVLRHVEADWIVASGSLPLGVPLNFYAQAAAIATERGQKFALDTSGPALAYATGSGTEFDLLKLSLSELEFLAGRQLESLAAQRGEALALLRDGGPRAIAVSLGREGALLASSNGVTLVPGRDVIVQSGVGAGDAFLGGLVIGFAQGLVDAEALALAVASGTAAVAAGGAGAFSRAEVDAHYFRIESELAAAQAAL